jgi:hypothetical protein
MFFALFISPVFARFNPDSSPPDACLPVQELVDQPSFSCPVFGPEARSREEGRTMVARFTTLEKAFWLCVAPFSSVRG